MIDNENRISEKLEEILEGFFRFPIKYIRTTFTLIFHYKTAFDRINPNNNWNFKDYVPPLTYFVVTYFAGSFCMDLIDIIDKYNNWVLPINEHVSTGVISNIIIDYSKIIGFEYIIEFTLPVLFIFFITIKLFSYIVSDKNERINLSRKIFYSISAGPLIPISIAVFPSVVYGESAFHSENDSYFWWLFLIFVLGSIFVIFITIKLSFSSLSNCTSIRISKKPFEGIVILFCLTALLFYCLSLFKPNKDLRGKFEKAKSEQSQIRK
jgi:hypothetical protein